jgi:hypothetical protein
MTHLQEHWVGVSLGGNYTIAKGLAGDGSSAFFEASLSSEGRPVIVKLVPEAVCHGAAPLDLWHRIRQLRHPNLVELLDFGRAEHGGENVCYAVFEAPDDSLASALGRSPLNSQESREVLDAVLDALRYLHAQGLVLAALDPDRIVAVGDRIKLSTDALRHAETSAACREDVRLLGELWRQALMPASERSEELAAHAADPDPKTRWTLAEIHAALSPPLPTAPVPLPPPVTSPAASGQPVVELPFRVAPAVVRNEPSVPPPSRPHPPEAVPVFRFPRWILVGTGLFLLLLFILNRPRHADVVAAPGAATAPAPAEASPPAPVPGAPVVAAPKPSPPKPSTSEGKAMWRVIAFTYRTRAAAEKKVQQLNEYHPGLNAAVFLPKRQVYYLVSLGGRMTREDAVRLQHTARGKGLPRDLYIQNYSE